MTSTLVADPPPAPPPSRELSPDLAISTSGLCKRYGERHAVRNLDIAIPRGVVAGFVGPNGAGKTTTIRMLLGLVRPTSGSATVLGSPVDRPRAYLPRVGALIESPAFYPSLSGRANLQVLASLGGFSLDRIPELIDVVGLTGRDRDRVSRYSLGMKQRLGIAGALLPNPELLILDEPSNGLDPPGIIEMRALMRRLRDQGTTVFMSSHLLGEVQQVADWLVVLKEGESVFAGPTNDILDLRSEGIVVVPERADQVESLARIAAAGGHVVTPDQGGLLVSAPKIYAGELNRLAMQAGITLVEIRSRQATLEDSFLSMIGDADGQGGQ
ncbi:MAG: ABC transporter ATP-binding protein [Candidatus Dormibacteraeota bacterium]|nr:ABC transporter ATP-binding protein [Candidatus Dormibacteraeota bacterium]